jgi:phenylalanyl-tRNA synthetase alpha chain
VGGLKEAKVVQIAQGGILALTSGADISSYEFLSEVIRSVGEKGQPDLSLFPENQRSAVHANYHKRGKSKGIFRITEKKDRSYTLTPDGTEILRLVKERGAVTEEASALTPEMMKLGTWKDKKFRAYNISINPPRQSIGRKHPYKEFLDFVKYKFIGMGFEEMRGPLVENEFWDMDALFMPQFHPARNIHDVYFVKEPALSRKIEEPFGKSVAAAHKDGGKTGSTGWRYAFDLERAKRLILRSQGTAVSARTLAAGPKIPGKYFSIARCFRYDAVDATHAPDFYQVEGIVLGKDINFTALLGLLKLFGQEIAKAEEFQFRPAYFPFTEPSVELHVKHPELGWMELGGAGIFRPEVTAPLGVNVPVIAWGLGLDRMAMVALGIQDIRDLFSTDLDFIRTKKIQLNK